MKTRIFSACIILIMLHEAETNRVYVLLGSRDTNTNQNTTYRYITGSYDNLQYQSTYTKIKKTMEIRLIYLISSSVSMSIITDLRPICRQYISVFVFSKFIHSVSLTTLYQTWCSWKEEKKRAILINVPYLLQLFIWSSRLLNELWNSVSFVGGLCLSILIYVWLTTSSRHSNSHFAHPYNINFDNVFCLSKFVQIIYRRCFLYGRWYENWCKHSICAKKSDKWKTNTVSKIWLGMSTANVHNSKLWSFVKTQTLNAGTKDSRSCLIHYIRRFAFSEKIQSSKLSSWVL